ncbi:EAL domain-containing protein [Rhizobium freirei]|nr:EAL domain-containing protein [Rhizobium freirei]
MTGLPSTALKNALAGTSRGTFLPSETPAISGGQGALRLDIRVLNRMHIVAAFGADAAEAAQRAMADAASRYLLSDAAIRAMLGVQLAGPGLTPVRQIDEDLIGVDLKAYPPLVDISLLIEGLSLALALEPVSWEGERIHVAPLVQVSGVATENVSNDGDDLLLKSAVSDPPFGGDPVLNGDDWSDRYRRDMTAAARLLNDLAADELKFAYQPVRMAGRSKSLLYSECLLRVPQFGEVVRQTGAEIIAMERLGLVRALDNHMVWRAIDRLQADPELRLGINISAQSARIDGWWAGLEYRLKAEPQLAQRLTIEITETSSIPSIPTATAFTDRMRALGCKIALDDFGAGRDAIRDLYALRPDIVKIDAFFLRQARHSEKGQAALKSLVGLARAFGGAVVAEGVETQVDSNAALEAGAAWQQGYFIDLPRLETPGAGCEVLTERPPIFGRRLTPPPHVESSIPVAFSSTAGALPMQSYFEARWLRWAIVAAAATWALLSIGV